MKQKLRTILYPIFYGILLLMGIRLVAVTGNPLKFIPYPLFIAFVSLFAQQSKEPERRSYVLCLVMLLAAAAAAVLALVSWLSR